MRVLVSLTCLMFLLAMLPGSQADPHEDWGTLAFSHEGAPGDWVFALQPFDPEVTDFGAEIWFDLTVEGLSDRDSGVLYLRPELIWSDEGELFAPFFDPEYQTVPAGEILHLSWRYGYGAAIGGASFGAMAVAVGAEGPWTLDVRVERDGGGPDVAPTRTASGTGTLLHTGDEMLDLPVHPADRLRLEADVSAGWHHYELVDHRIQPNGVRQYDLDFPGGFSYETIGVGRGVDAAVLGFSSRTNMPDGIGVMADGAGRFTGEVAYAETSWDIDALLLELPGFTEEAAGFATHYTAYRWPFGSPLPPDDGAPAPISVFREWTDPVG